MNRVHHLNCGSMHPPGVPGGMVCHVLLVETEKGLVLVDSGFGIQDAAAPGPRFGPARFLVRPAFDSQEAAVRQLPALGFDPRDVRHIVLTHFDADHVGGLDDFGWAQVHLTSAEAQAKRHPKGFSERARYRAAQRDHENGLVEHDPRRGEAWRGFASAIELADVAPGIVLIGLAGHTRGHAAVAVDTGDRWIVHVGDAFYHHGQVDGQASVPAVVSTFERVVAHDWTRVQANHQLLQEIWAAKEPDLLLVNAHDPTLLRDAAAAAR